MLGILATSVYIVRTIYLEALRESNNTNKIKFLSKPEIERLINADYKLSEFKSNIYIQVKDN